jgi:hypothetical protein
MNALYENPENELNAGLRGDTNGSDGSGSGKDVTQDDSAPAAGIAYSLSEHYLVRDGQSEPPSESKALRFQDG